MTPFYVMEVMRAAEERERAGGDVLHLEVGQPSTGAPEGVLRAAEVALRSGPLGYTTAKGILPLRERIADHYRDRYGVIVDPERIIATAGASGGFVLTFLAAFSPGMRVAVTEPGYPCYRNTLEAFGIEAVGVPVGPETRFQPTAALLEAAGPLDGVVVASPANPTGTALDDRELAALAAWCEGSGVRLVADEIYHGITYGRPVGTALAHSAGAVVLNSFSKYFSMTGWRLGWLVAPDDLVTPIERIAQNLYICPPTIAQHAAVAAFDCGEELDRHVERYATNRRVLLEGLRAAGIDRVAPADGAFYVYAEVSHLTDDAQALCRTWLAELGVAATPGIDFDPVRGHRFVRFSFAGATEDIAEAVRRLGVWLEARD